MKPLRVSFLGAGDAFSAAGRHQAGYLVEGSETSFLLDCGATILASLKRDGVRTDSIDSVFLSHLHGDHFAGLPFLFLEYTYVEPRRRPLRIAGPPGTEERIISLYRAMYKDAAADPLPFALEFLEMLPDKALYVDDVRLDPFRVPHQEHEISLGIGVHVDGRRILYSGDTGWTEDLIGHSEGADLFICECCFFETRLRSHLDYPRLDENQTRFGARRLILTHLGREVLEHQSEIKLELARDGLVIEI